MRKNVQGLWRPRSGIPLSMLALVVGCGAAPDPVTTPAEPLAPAPIAPESLPEAEVAAQPEPLPPAPSATHDAADAGVRSEARQVLTEQLEHFRQLDATAFSSFYADDVFVFGPTADEVLLGRDAARDAVDSEMGPLRQTKHLTVTATEPRLGAEGNDLAWALDDVVVATGRGQSQSTLFRVGSVLSRGPHGLRIVGQAWSVTLPNDVTLPMAEARRFPAPKLIAPSVDPGAAPVSALIEELLSGRSEPKVSGRRDTFFSGTAADEIAIGDHALARLLAGFVDATRAGRVNNTMVGGLYARTRGVGVVAAYHLEVQTQKPAVKMPIRHFSLYVKQGEVYRPVLALSSFGFPDT